MATTRTYNRSFAGGEVSPQMFGRIDDAKYQTGAARVRNFIATPTGAATNRTGFGYVNATKNNGVARLIPFAYSLGQTMVIELGDKYVRFHTQGATLKYAAAGVESWIAPSGDISLSYTTPTIVTWAGHGLSTGDPIRFYLYGGHAPSELPAGFQVGYTYTAQVIDGDTFYILDNGQPVALPQSGGGATTNYPGTGTTEATIVCSPNQTQTSTSPVLTGLASTPVTGGLATLNVGINSIINNNGGSGSLAYQYSTGGAWSTFYTSFSTEAKTVSVQIPIADLDQLQLRTYVSGRAISSGSYAATAEIATWSVDIPTVPGGGLDFVRAYRYYNAGDLTEYSGSFYAAMATDSGGTTTPGTDPAIWALLPADLTYEITSPYAAADLFSIHYTQSADVLTLVHPNYPPQELRRLGVTNWSLTPISFGPPLATPLTVAVKASPGYKAKISSISLADPALIETVSSHTLALGDPIYLANLTAVTGGGSQELSGFYMVAKVPVDGDGNLIPNQLNLMDYSGNNLDSSSWSSYHATDSTQPITIQYGTKIFNITNNYAVQAIGADGISASALSAAASVLNDLDVPGSFNTITWAASATAQSYNVYKQLNGLWGYIGNTQALTFADNNIAPDMSIVPGTPDAVFSAPGDYPGAVCYFQQRRSFAGTLNAPQNCWMSNSGTESMFSYSLPTLDTDRIAFRVAALKADTIQHLLPMLQLIMLTNESEFALSPGGTNAVTPSTVSVDPQSYVGASPVQPTIVNTSMVYAAARGGHVRELGYAWTVNGYMTGDLSLRAAHLFDNFSIVDQAYAKAPWPIVWFVSSSGKLLGLTYIPEEQVGAWHRHDTDGSFESIACVAEGQQDSLYAVINRNINGSTVRYVERMVPSVLTYIEDPDEPNAPQPIDPLELFYVDAGIMQVFDAPVSQISGLAWLEGCTVAILADGGVQSQKIVAGGAITLDHPAKVVTVGLPYICDLQTLPPALQIDGFGQGRKKNINKAWIKVYLSSGIRVGPDAAHLTEVKQRTTEAWGSPPALQTAELEVMTTPSWQQEGQAFIRQQDPLPLTVVGLTLEVAIGG